MSRVENSSYGDGFNWSKNSLAEVQAHPAWFEIDEQGAEQRLRGSDPFTYILRKGEKDLSYFISFVKSDGSIKHQWFDLLLDAKGWYFKNGALNPTGKREEIFAETLSDLIPKMMHCEPSECKELENSRG